MKFVTGFGSNLVTAHFELKLCLLRKKTKKIVFSFLSFIKIFEMEIVSPECVFCGKQNEEMPLIDMATNSIMLEDEMIEFSDLIFNLLLLKVCLHFYFHFYNTN